MISFSADVKSLDTNDISPTGSCDRLGVGGTVYLNTLVLMDSLRICT